MNLIEAIESCLPFRRAGQPDWKTRFSVEYRLTHSSVGGLYGTQLQQLAKVEKHVIDLSLTDLLAKDWETKGPSISITKVELRLAMGRAGFGDVSFDELAKELGL